MALVKCHECGDAVSTEAKTCPKCGAKVKKPTSRILKGILILFIFGAVMSAFQSQQKHADEQKKPPEQRAQEAAAKQKQSRLDSARYMCKESVTKSLHDPKSAEFDDYFSWAAGEVSDGIYAVQATLRAKNAFNAMRKITMDCRVQLANGNWKLVSLKQQE